MDSDFLSVYFVLYICIGACSCGGVCDLIGCAFISLIQMSSETIFFISWVMLVLFCSMSISVTWECCRMMNNNFN